ncbi:MAG: pitrilysin family protein [Candidatus Pacearchaeota archaeon]|nr:pitrilysin family protein [Candidatus Pacearchaeota archaeon]
MHAKFYRKILKNGMTIILEKRDVPVVSVAFAVRTGGINEAASEKGISHFIEHLLYKGTPSRDAKKIAEEIEKNGGILNGFTDETITAFWCKMPSKHLSLALNVLGDMIKNPLFDEKEIEKERKVIFEEIHLYKDNPHLYVFQEIHRFLYKKPFGTPLIGTRETLNSLSREKIVRKFKQIYQPNNMILCVVGNASFKDLVNFAEINFGKMKGSVPRIKVSKHNYSKTEKRKGIDQANMVFAYHIPTDKEKGSHAAFVLNTLLAGGMSSRLFSEIREKRNLAYSVKGDSIFAKDFAYSIIYIGTKKENIPQVKEIILREFEKASKEIPEKELLQVKEQIVGNYQISLEDSHNQMLNLLYHEINGNAKRIYDFEKKIRSVKMKDVKALAKKVKGKDYSFFALVPG